MIFRRSFAINLSIQTKSQHRWKYEWAAPVGHDTGIKVHNEIAKRKVPLIFPNPNFVKWYMCGPTVYDSSHIGHASCYMRTDIIRRILREYFDIDPVVAIGITDVSEKIFERSAELNQSPRALAKKYELEFFSQMTELNILPPAFILRVTDHVPVLINFISKLLKKGAAYKTVDGGVYFKTYAHPNYGRFKVAEPDHDQAKVPGKLNSLDFALWKGNTSTSGKSKGLPGWHIQCSAMASHIFGDSLDIHSGGADLIFPHHENEESQCTAYHDCDQWVNYWIHTGLLNMKDEKMSKSLKNYISVKEYLEKNSGDHLRMFCMMAPYRTSTSYDPRTIELAVNMCDKVVRFCSVSDSYIKGTWPSGNIKEAELLEEIRKSQEIIRNHLSNDFGVHDALKCMLFLIKNAMKMMNDNAKETTARSPAVIATLHAYVNKFFKSFGFSFADVATKNKVPSALEALIDTTVKFRTKVREKASFMEGMARKRIMTLCDETRDNLQTVGVAMNDISPSHTHWSLKTNKMNNGSTLKNVIDVLVWFRAEVLKALRLLTSESSRRELLEISRWAQMHLSTLGVIIEDFEDGRSYWSFPKADDQATSKYEMIINSTLKFHAEIRNVAMSLIDETPSPRAQEILELCDAAESDLKSYGITITDASHPEWSLEVNNNKGVSIIQNIMDMLMCSRDQVKSLSFLAPDEETSLRLTNICHKTKKFLIGYGLKIADPYDRNNPTTWSVDENKRNKVMVKSLIDVLVMFMNEIKETAETLRYDKMKDILLEMYNSLERNLKGIGVILIDKDGKLTWSFKDCEAVADTLQQ